MKIGTPKSPHATRVLMLGSGELGKEVVIELQRFGVELWHFDGAIRSQPLQAVRSPHFRERANVEQRIDIVCVASSDDDQASPPGVDDLLQHGNDAGVWDGALTIHFKRSERSVIVQQKGRLWCLRNRADEFTDLVLCGRKWHAQISFILCQQKRLPGKLRCVWYQRPDAIRRVP